MNTIYTRVSEADSKYFVKYGITKNDVLEALGAAMDTLEAIQPSIEMPFGHGKSYWEYPGFREYEFLAHCFELSFQDNRIFKKIFPELHDEMISIVEQLKPAK